ncbi:MAG: hypothetical protein P8N43_15650 [Alphaproteobacteria bacterium]|nr:hypothetical protein [Alphaproteobacteria bacterium]
MQFDEFSSKLDLFSNAILLLYQEHQAGVFSSFYTASVLLHDDFHAGVFGEFKNYINHIVGERKTRFSNRILDVEEYVDQLVIEGINDANIAEYEIYRSYDISSEVINIYRLKYTIQYYEGMTDSTSSDSWVYHPLEYEKLKQDNHLYFVSKTELLFQQLDL